MRKVLGSAFAATLLLLGLATGSVFAGNPSGSGQPSASCGSSNATMMPNGFTTAGFANAGTHYAGSPGTPSAANGNPHAVSQYDVACYQVTLHH
jgi:hypothetical protein